MRNLKRALSLALALVMVLSMMVVGAGAVSVDDFSDADEIVNKEAVTVLATLGVITGNDDGSYAPADTISRAEMSTIICRVLNGGKDPVLGEAVSNSYTDTTSHWAKNYIEYCTTLGIVAGKGDGTFDPEGDVTVAEAAKMVLVALGYNAAIEGYTGGAWQINVDARANPLGLYDDLTYTTTSAPLTRDNAAQMLYNALDCDMVRYDYVLDTTSSTLTGTTQLTSTDETLLEDKFDAVKVEGVVIANEIANLETSGHLNDERTRIRVTNYDDQRYYGNSAKTATVDFTITTGLDELGRSVTIYVKKEPTSTNAQVLGSVIVSEDNVVITDYSADSIADVADDNNLEIGNAQLATNYGGATSLSNTIANNEQLRGVEKILIDYDDDTDVDYVILNTYYFGKVTSYVTSGDGSISVSLGEAGTMSEDDAVDVIGFDDVARDDYVIAAEIGGRIHLSLAETMTGVLDAYKQDTLEAPERDGETVTTKLTVDGEEYDVSSVKGFTGGTGNIRAAWNYQETYLDNEATFYLTVGGYLTAVGETDENAYRYALVLAKGSTGLEDRVRVMLSDGTSDTYDIASNSEYDNDDDGDKDVQVGEVYRYSINSAGEIRLSQAWNKDEATAAKFTQGRSAITSGDEAGYQYYATNNTAFFYVGLDSLAKTNISTDVVDVYTGYKAAPDLDNIPAIRAVVYTREEVDTRHEVGAVVFYGDDSLVTADVDQTLYVSAIGTRNNDYINATAFIAGDPEAQAIRIDIDDNVAVRSVYTYTINSDGYYEVEPVATELPANSFGSNNDDLRKRVTNDDGTAFVVAGEGDFVATADTLLVDHSKDLSSPVGQMGSAPYENDLILWAVYNNDHEAILVVVRNDETGSTTGGDTDEGDGYSVSADVTERGRGILDFTIERAPYAAPNAGGTISFDLYVNGAYDGPMTAALSGNSARWTSSNGEYDEGDDLTVDNVFVTYDAVRVQYVDENGDPITVSDETETVNTIGSQPITFTLDNGYDAIGSVADTDITVTGATKGTFTNTSGTLSGNVTSVTGRDYVTIQVSGLTARTSWTISSDSSSLLQDATSDAASGVYLSQFKQADGSANTSSDRLALVLTNAGTVSGTSVTVNDGTRVNFSVAVDNVTAGSPAVAAYDVAVTIDGTTYTARLTSAKKDTSLVTLTINKDIVINKEDITVTPVLETEIENALLSARYIAEDMSIELTFRDAIDASTATDTNLGLTGLTLDPEQGIAVDGSTVTIYLLTPPTGTSTITPTDGLKSTDGEDFNQLKKVTFTVDGDAVTADVVDV